MSKRTIFATLLAVLSLTHACLAAEVNPPMKGQAFVRFPEWGFGAEIPSPYEKFVLPTAGDVLSHQIFINGEYAYVVKVTKTPATTLASTYIEQTIQNYIKAAAPGASKRFELDSRQGDLFKGVTIPLTTEMATNTAISKVLNGRQGVISIAMAPIKDETSPVLSVGVISTENLKREVENRTSVLATFLKFSRTTGSTKPTTGSPKLPPLPGTIKPTTPKPVTQIDPKPSPRYTLKKGDIELSGTVTLISGTKSLEMTVNMIRMPGEGSITLNPPVAGKKVLLNSLPAGVKVGSNIVVAGKNMGKGAPIKAQAITLAPATGV